MCSQAFHFFAIQPTGIVPLSVIQVVIEGLNTSKYQVNIPPMSIAVLTYYLESDESTRLFYASDIYIGPALKEMQ